MTFLVFVILNVATHPNLKDNSFYGFAIGLTVMAGAYSVGTLSGGVFNPAVSIGPSLVDLITGMGISQHVHGTQNAFSLINLALALYLFV